MKQFLNNPWVVGGLCIIALVMVYVRLFDRKSTPEPPPVVAQVPTTAPTSEPSLPVPVTSAPEPEILSSSNAPEDWLLNVGWPETLNRDPFQPAPRDEPLGIPELERGRRSENPELAREGRGELRLHAVFLEGATRMAMINRELVKEGQSIHGYVVDRIQQDGVWLAGQDEPHWLAFNVQPEPPRSAS